MKPAATQGGLSGRDLIAALVIIFIWGTNFVAMKFALRDFTPFQLGAARYLLTALPMLLIVKPPRLHWKWLLLSGLFQGVGQFGFLFTALKVGMTGALASVLMQTQVFFTAILGYALLRERVPRPLQIGLLLAALALGCFSMNYLLPQAASSNATTALGFGLTLCGASMWASANIVARKAQQDSSNFNPLSFVVWSGLVPVLPFALMSWMADEPASHWRWTEAGAASWLSACYLAWMGTVLANAMWTGLLKRHPANRIAPLSLGVPVVGLTAGMLVLGETITPWQWVGIALVVTALACVLFGGRWQAASAKTIANSR